MDSQQLIQSLTSTELYSPPPHSTPNFTITLSRGYGCGGEMIAKQLAEQLGLPYYDSELVESVANAAKLDKALMEQLDERVKMAHNSWLHSLFGDQGAFQENYRRSLINVVLGIAQSGGVIVGRGANLILTSQQAFRVRISGSLAICAKRLAANKGIKFKEAEQAILKVEQDRSEFIERFYHRDIDDSSTFDLILNTDRFSFDQAVHLILLAMQMSGYKIPDKALASASGH